MSSGIDNYNRADTAIAIGTPSDAGSAWEQLFGVWGINGNQGYESASTVFAICVLQSSETDGTVSVKLAVLPAATKSAGVVTRSSAAWGDAYYFEYLNDFGGFLRFYKFVGGSGTSLGTLNTSISAGDTLSIVTVGNTLTPKVNGSNPGLSGGPTYTDTFNNTATRHGMWSYNDSTCRFEDFAFTGAAPPPSPLPLQSLLHSRAVIRGSFY